MTAEGGRVVVETGGAEQTGRYCEGAGIALRTALVASAINSHKRVAAGREACVVF